MPLKGRIEVNERFCKGCELCVDVCPKDVIKMDLDHLTSKGYHPAVLYQEGCTGCMICAVICPEAAITVYREKPSRSKKPLQTVLEVSSGA